MKRMLLGMVIGIAVVCTIFLWPESSISASEMPAEKTEYSDTEKSDINGLFTALIEAEKTIQDENLKQYYRSLIEEYNLDTLTIQVTTTELLPDIEHIIRTAMSMPLKEAGKNIRDKEIADFYQEFLNDAGWEFEW